MQATNLLCYHSGKLTEGDQILLALKFVQMYMKGPLCNVTLKGIHFVLDQNRNLKCGLILNLPNFRFFKPIWER